MKSLHKVAILLISAMFTNACNSQEELIAEGASLTLVADGFKFTEGPAADAEGNIYFTDQPNNRIMKWNVEDKELSVFMEDAGRANGLFFDKKGNLFACADGNSQLWKIDEDKNVSVVVGEFEGKRMNGPNDLWIAPNGGIYFTDPYYQRPYWEHSKQPIEKERVYYLSPGENVPAIAAEDLVKPNGIIGTADGKILYVADIGDNKTWSYTIAEAGNLHNKSLLTELGSDGMTIDERGNIYLTGNGVTVFDRTGKQLLHIPVEKEWTANVTFGGTENKTLFITAMDALYSLEMNVKGQ